jgi:3D (Asp-Asp-Asp) domain-containing protein
MAWIGAAIGAGAGLLGGMQSQSGANSANSMSNKMALRQMMFQRDMSSTAHRREVNDLRKAGLNPILSGTGGAGASSPSGATSTFENAKGAGVSSALDALAKTTQAILTKTQTDNIKAQTENTQAKTLTEQQNPENVRASTGLIREQATTAQQTQRNIAADTRLKEIGSQVSVSEINKNNAFTNLLQKQGVTQDIQSKLLGVNVEQATQILQGQKLDGDINGSQFGEIMRYIDRTLETVNKIPILNKWAPKGSRASRDR